MTAARACHLAHQSRKPHQQACQLEHSRSQLGDVGSVDDVRAAGRALAGFSPTMQAQERRLKAFMYERLYYHPDQKQTAERARDVIAALFVAYS